MESQILNLLSLAPDEIRPDASACVCKLGLALRETGEQFPLSLTDYVARYVKQLRFVSADSYDFALEVVRVNPTALAWFVDRDDGVGSEYMNAQTGQLAWFTDTDRVDQDQAQELKQVRFDTPHGRALVRA